LISLMVLALNAGAIRADSLRRTTLNAYLSRKQLISRFGGGGYASTGPELSGRDPEGPRPPPNCQSADYARRRTERLAPPSPPQGRTSDIC